MRGKQSVYNRSGATAATNRPSLITPPTPLPVGQRGNGALNQRPRRRGKK